MGLGAIDSGDGDTAEREKRSLVMAGPTWRVVAMKLFLAGRVNWGTRHASVGALSVHTCM